MISNVATETTRTKKLRVGITDLRLPHSHLATMIALYLPSAFLAD